ncbi:MAG: DUF2334 domain-containing protein [Candidatus Omnitrophota bacterium]
MRLCLFLLFMTLVGNIASTHWAFPKSPVVILKADDVVYSDACRRFTDYIEQKKIKAALGVVAKSLNDDSLCTWLRSLATKSNFEIWNHGLIHDCSEHQTSEFEGNPYLAQLHYLRKSQQLFKGKTGITCMTWGAPCNFIDENTARALSEVEDIKIWLFGGKESGKLVLERRGNIEFPTLKPDVASFVEKYNQDKLDQCDYLVFQLHPHSWDAANFAEFQKVIDYLLQKQVVFMTPAEYYRSVTEIIRVDHTDGSDHLLRAAITRANAQKGKHTIIMVSPGTYTLTGTSNDDANVGGDLDMDADIDIEGTDASKTIIDGNGIDRIFHILGGKVSISGITVRHGKAVNGGGIRIDGGTVRINHCTLTQNTTVKAGERLDTGGGGIYVGNANVSISHCIITQNTGDSDFRVYGGGIYVTNSHSSKMIDIYDNRIEANTANTQVSGRGAGGGIALKNARRVILENNLIAHNRASIKGSGLFFTGKPDPKHPMTTTCTLIRNTIAANNPGKEGEGIYAWDQVSLTLTRNLISGHTVGISVNDPTQSTIEADTNLFHNTNDPIKGKNAIITDPLLDAEFKPTADLPVRDIGCVPVEITEKPLIAFDKSTFYFGVVKGDKPEPERYSHYQTGTQECCIDNRGTGTLNWTAQTAEKWIRLSQWKGNGGDQVKISVNPIALAPGTHTGKISITDPHAVNSPQYVTVHLAVYAPERTTPPLGALDKPANGTSGITGTITLTGWALDDIGVKKVEIRCDQENPAPPVLMGNAAFIAGIRPDIEQTYPALPLHDKAGWEYSLLTNLLPRGGNGTYSLRAVAVDKEGKRTTLGTQTITCDNAHGNQPFGMIETPLPDEIIFGKHYTNWGWALIPQPNQLPTDGSAIHVMIDGTDFGRPHYNINRPDIERLFPGYANTNGAVGYFLLDTTRLSDGRHLMQWMVTDSAGNPTIIASRYFRVKNKSQFGLDFAEK